MAKLNPNIKQVAQKGGVRIPPKPRPPAGIKTPDQLKKQAEARAKSRLKRLIRILVVAGVLLVIGLVVYFVKFYGRMPKDAWKQCVEYAYKDNIIKFQECFTVDSIEMVESSDGASDEKWEHLMDGITPPSKDLKVVKEDVKDEKGVKTAEMAVNIDGDERTVYMRQEDGKWRINLNVAINPHKITLPNDIPPEYIDNFDVSDEPEAWWEDDDENGKKKQKNGGFFSNFSFRKFFRSS